MLLFAVAGGGGFSEEDLGGCCAYPIAASILLLACIGMIARKYWPCLLGLVVGGIPCLLLHVRVAGYEPSRDWEITEDQAAGRSLVWFYFWLAVVAGVSIGFVGWCRLVDWFRRRRAGRGPSPPHAEGVTECSQG